MGVVIGHASIDEKGKTLNGSAGDQTGKEVCTRNFYMHTKGWYALRAKDTTVANKIAECMEHACSNSYIGYDQNQRLTLYNVVKNNGYKCSVSVLKQKVECDCSSLVRVCLGYAGIIVGDFTTSNEKTVIMNTGKFDLVECTSDGSTLRRGDILVTKTKGHTAIVISTTYNKEKTDVNMPTIRKGSIGEPVILWQIIVGAKPDGDFGDDTERLTLIFQDEKGLTTDGIVGEKSWKAGVEELRDNLYVMVR